MVPLAIFGTFGVQELLVILAIVVLPTPPLPEATAMMFLMLSIGSSPVIFPPSRFLS